MIFDPSTTRPSSSGSGTVRDQFPNNSVPVTRFDPVSVKVLQADSCSHGNQRHQRQPSGTTTRPPGPPSEPPVYLPLKSTRPSVLKGGFHGYFQETVNPTQYGVGPAQGDGLLSPLRKRAEPSSIASQSVSTTITL